MATYTHEYSNFPEELYTLHHFKDVDDSVASLVNNIKAQMKAGKYNQAQYLVEQNKDVLAPYVINMETMNGLEEETRNLEIYAQSRQQCVYVSSVEPDTASVNDVWIQ